MTIVPAPRASMSAASGRQKIQRAPPHLLLRLRRVDESRRRRGGRPAAINHRQAIAADSREASAPPEPSLQLPNDGTLIGPNAEDSVGTIRAGAAQRVMALRRANAAPHAHRRDAGGRHARMIAAPRDHARAGACRSSAVSCGANAGRHGKC